MTIFASFLVGRPLPKSRFAQRYPSRIMSPRRNFALVSSRVPRFCLPVVGSLAWDGVKTSYCESLAVSEPVVVSETIILREPHGQESLQQKIRHLFRLWRRFIKLLITLTPVAALYPLQKLLKWTKSVDQEQAHDALMMGAREVEGPLGWYLNMCLYCVESSGAAVVKLMQWAGSRPDLFGQDFCAVFSRLQDDTTPHSWRHTERVMKEAYGDNWEENIHLGKVVGSGCIGQVYEGTVKGANGKEERVAIKGKIRPIDKLLSLFDHSPHYPYIF